MKCPKCDSDKVVYHSDNTTYLCLWCRNRWDAELTEVLFSKDRLPPDLKLYLKSTGRYIRFKKIKELTKVKLKNIPYVLHKFEIKSEGETHRLLKVLSAIIFSRCSYNICLAKASIVGRRACGDYLVEKDNLVSFVECLTVPSNSVLKKKLVLSELGLWFIVPERYGEYTYSKTLIPTIEINFSEERIEVYTQ